MLCLLPVTIGRANSTKSSMRTGHAPGKRERNIILDASKCPHNKKKRLLVFPAGQKVFTRTYYIQSIRAILMRSSNYQDIVFRKRQTDHARTVVLSMV